MIIDSEPVLRLLDQFHVITDLIFCANVSLHFYDCIMPIFIEIQNSIGQLCRVGTVEFVGESRVS